MELLILSSRGRPPAMAATATAMATRPASMHHTLPGSARAPAAPASGACSDSSSAAPWNATEAAGAAEPWRAAGAGLGGPWGGRRASPLRSRSRPAGGAAAPPPARLVSMVHSLRASAPGGGPAPRLAGVPLEDPQGPGFGDVQAAAGPRGGPENSGNASLNACGAPASERAECPGAARSAWPQADAGERDAHMGVWPPPPGARGGRAKPVADTPLGELPGTVSLLRHVKIMICECRPACNVSRRYCRTCLTNLLVVRVVKTYIVNKRCFRTITVVVF